MKVRDGKIQKNFYCRKKTEIFKSSFSYLSEKILPSQKHHLVFIFLHFRIIFPILN